MVRLFNLLYGRGWAFHDGFKIFRTQCIKGNYLVYAPRNFPAHIAVLNQIFFTAFGNPAFFPFRLAKADAPGGFRPLLKHTLKAAAQYNGYAGTVNGDFFVPVAFIHKNQRVPVHDFQKLVLYLLPKVCATGANGRFKQLVRFVNDDNQAFRCFFCFSCENIFYMVTPFPAVTCKLRPVDNADEVKFLRQGAPYLGFAAACGPCHDDVSAVAV